MMKKVLSVIFVLTFMLPLFAWTGNAPAHAVNDIWIKEYSTDIFGDPTDDFYLMNRIRFSGTYESADGKDGFIEAEIAVGTNMIYFALYENGSKEIMQGIENYDVAMKDANGERVDFTARAYSDFRRVFVYSDYYQTVIDALSAPQGEVAFFLKDHYSYTRFLFRAQCGNFAEIYEREIVGKMKADLYERATALFEKKNYAEAFDIFRNLEDYSDSHEKKLAVAEALGGIEGICKIADNYYEGTDSIKRDYTEAMKWYLRAADLGSAEAMWRIGVMYYHGEGVEYDPAAAMDWDLKAAELGNENAMCSIAFMYYYGNGVDQNAEEARNWFVKAAELGEGDAAYMLGDIYQYGNGVEVSYDTALEWYQKAASVGHEGANQAIQDMIDNELISPDVFLEPKYQAALELLTNKQYEEAFMEFAELGDYRDSAQKLEEAVKAIGGPDAITDIGDDYYYGFGDCEQSYEIALIWYQKAAGLGSARAYENLGDMYLLGNVENKDPEKAAAYYSEAERLYTIDANNGDRYASYALGNLYYYSYHGMQHYEKAMEWFQKAAQQGYSFAMDRIGDLYRDGKGVQQDYQEAYNWYEKAVKAGYPKISGHNYPSGKMQELVDKGYIKINDSMDETSDEEGTLRASAQGRNGLIEVEVKADENEIYSVKVVSHSETEGIGSVAVEELPARIVESQSLVVDGISGATLSSDAIKQAVRNALDAAEISTDSFGIETVVNEETDIDTTVEETPVDEATSSQVSYIPGTYEAKATGMGIVKVSVTVDDHSIVDVVLDTSGETPEIGGAATEALHQQVLDAQGADIDGVSGASMTSGAVREAVEDCLSQARRSASAVGDSTVADLNTIEGETGTETDEAQSIEPERQWLF